MKIKNKESAPHKPDYNKKGDVVTIYEDPSSKSVVEGTAKLLYRHEGALEYWRVEFVTPEEDRGFRTDRIV